ncbi:TetR/AcrR family transcriptional regulator [Arthrobacter crystallopoietes]|jgi:AcrR family transcriptional regulator|uniref:TetR/AcrR family transcriptional regulator n=1 Tax=Crystallibacter crystallopoietes TaxID=37928 RepID=UPI001486040B|nr:TetR/AcrR family transcriptional regulator [Arthrobacter crystallopoietes]QTG80935.1 TetR/AcrR family transcriptional regulator [Arthrobacter crystallopoietes]
MARPQNLQRKPQLLAGILDYLQDKNLAGLSFRSLAEGLGISSYMLVYHFGSREQLVAEIVAQVQSGLAAPPRDQMLHLAPEGFREQMLRLWSRSMTVRGRQLQRLGFEAAMQDPGGAFGTHSADLYGAWQDVATGWLQANGVAPETAEVEGRLFAAGVHGLLYEHVLTGDTEQTTAGFRLLLDRYLSKAASSPTLEP